MRATCDFNASDPINLSFKRGDIIGVLAEDPSAWFKGELNGVEGFFPSTFAKQCNAYAISKPQDTNPQSKYNENKFLQSYAQPKPVCSVPDYKTESHVSLQQVDTSKQSNSGLIGSCQQDQVHDAIPKILYQVCTTLKLFV